jgi:hypothetical protein
MNYNIYTIPETGIQVVPEVKQYCEIAQNMLKHMLFNDISNVVSFTENASDGTVNLCGIQTEAVTVIPNSKPTILLCVENCSVGRQHYKHFNQFGHFNDSRISIYIYNDISQLIKTDKYIAIPFIYIYIDNFIRLQKELQIKEIPFEKKKFCLFTSRNLLNSNKQLILNELSKIGKIDHISQYTEIENVTCYHDPKLLEVFNKYKFIICFENSKTDGYITEKIFNVFLSKSIPIYDGAPNIYKFISPQSFIEFEQSHRFIKKIELLSKNKKLYEHIINSNKIAQQFNNENWVDELQSRLNCL